MLWHVLENSRLTLQFKWFDTYKAIFFPYFLQCKNYISEYSDLAIQMMMHMVRSVEYNVCSQFIFLLCLANLFGNRKHLLHLKSGESSCCVSLGINALNLAFHCIVTSVSECFL